MKNSLILDIKLCGYVEVKSSSPPPFPSLLYLSTFHRFSTFPFPLFPFHSYPTLPFSYLPLTLPFYFPSLSLPQFPIFLFPSQPSSFRLNLPSLSSAVTLPLFLSFSTSLFSLFSPFSFPFSFPFPRGEERILYTPVG